MRHPEGQAREAEERRRRDQAGMHDDRAKQGHRRTLTPPHSWSHTVVFFFLLWTKADGLGVFIDLLTITCALLRTPAHTDINPLPSSHSTPLAPSLPSPGIARPPPLALSHSTSQPPGRLTSLCSLVTRLDP